MQRMTTAFGTMMVVVALLVSACGSSGKGSPGTGPSGGQGGVAAAEGGDGAGGLTGSSGRDPNQAGTGAGPQGDGGSPSGEPSEPSGAGTANGAGGDGTAEPEPAPTVPPGCDSALDFTVATHFYDAVRCLFTGADALQVDVADGALDAERIAVLRGRIRDASGRGLEGVTVTQVQDTRVGRTSSRADGRYDMAVQGGGQITLRFEKDGYLPVQRQQSVTWQEFGKLRDIVMLKHAATASHVALEELTEPLLLRGEISSDDSGARQQALVIAPGTVATLERTDGTLEPLSELDVRMVEYTVGADGPAAMPGNLPPSSAYTYAVDLAIDQAQGPDVRTVRFDPPLRGYVDNFLEFPAGTVVPLGYFEASRDVWQASDSGLVVDVLAIEGGLALLDADGDGIAEQPAQLAALGIDDLERATLGAEYVEGDSLWRISLPHFSAWDCNWPFGPPADAQAPQVEVEVGDTDDCRTPRDGSIIGCEDQTLGEVLPISGTPYALHYQSERMPGRKDGRALNIRPLGGQTSPASAKRIDVEVDVLGVQLTATLPIEGGTRHGLSWDGLDAWGRAWQGRQNVKVRVGYVYDGAYQNALRFGQVGDGIPITGDRSREEITLWTEWRGKLGGLDQRATGLGGWSLDAQHLFDPRGGTLWLGSGERRTAERIGNAIDTVAGTGTAGFQGDGGPAKAARISSPHGLVVAPDGSVFVSDEASHRVRKILPDGIITTYVGTGAATNTGDGALATAASISQPLGLALTPGGVLYVSGRGGRIRMVDPTTGLISTMAGGGTPADGRGDGGFATDAAFREPHAIAFTPEGSLLVVDALEHTVRRIAPDGLISTICGQPGTASSLGDGGPANLATLNSPLGIAVARDGSIYISEWEGHRVRKIDSNGVITTLAGTGVAGFTGDGGQGTLARLRSPHSVAVGPDGSVYITDEGNDRVRRIGNDGVIETIAGGGTEQGDGGAPLQARFQLPRVVYYHSDGTVWVADYEGQRIRRIKPGLPGFSTRDTLLASGDGTEVYVFDDHGKHLKTVDSLLSVTTERFSYDAQGLLVGVTDRNDNVTTIERDTAGVPLAIVGPYGERTELTVDSRGYLSAIKNAAAETTLLEHDENGLLTRLERPRDEAGGDVHHFSYDELGRLVRDEGPSGVVQTLELLENATGHEVSAYENGERGVSYAVDDVTVQGQTTRTLTDPYGLESTRVSNGTTTTSTSPVTTATATLGGDPRFGMVAASPITQRVVLSPSHVVSTATTRTAVLSEAANPLSLSALTETVTVNSRSTTRSWDGAARTWTIRSPASRQLQVKFDERGRPVGSQLGALTPERLEYDARGRLTSSTVGSRAFLYEYDEAGYLSSVIDPLGHTTSFVRDAVGRVLSTKYADGSVVGLTQNAAWDMIAVTPPGRGPHTFSFGPGGLAEKYSPPVAGNLSTPTSYAYDAFAQLSTVSLPTAETVEYSYDKTAGRLTGVKVGESSVQYGYSASTGQLLTATRGNDSVTTTFTGAVPTRFDWAGGVSGSVSFTYDTSLRLTSDRLNSNTVSFSYDADGLLTAAGAARFVRDTATGALSSTALGTLSESFARDELGELVDHLVQATGATLYERIDTRDGLGRVVERQETILGEVHDLTYEYDARGRLIQTERDGVVVGAYDYDGNGNRLSATRGSETLAAEYDSQDRQVSYGATEQSYDARGRLTEKRDGAKVTTYAYDAFGPLRSVATPDGRLIEYVLDSSGRRVGKKIDGTLQKQWLYRSDLAPLGELGPTGTLVSRFVYGDGGNVPEYLVNGGVNYKLVTDLLGSVRLVVNAATGAVIQRIDYDEFGRVLLDTNPGFQPFGFAGGLYDPDTGLVRFGARDYDAETGRWTTKDPIGFGGGDTNLYAYVGNDPINAVDPTGLAVGAPGFAESLIPVWGAGRTAVNDFQCGNYGSAAIHAVFAVSDVFLLKAIAAGAIRGVAGLGAGAARGGGGLADDAVRASTPVGRRGAPLTVAPGTNAPATIGGRNFTGHALDQMQSRGFTPTVVENAIQHGARSAGNQPGTFQHMFEGVRVITNEAGGVITVIPR